MGLSHYQSTAVDGQGNVLSSATVTVRSEATGALAALKADRAGSVGKDNPFSLTSPDNGQFDFYVAGGAYKVTVTSGSLTRTLRYVAMGTAAELDQEDLAGLQGMRYTRSTLTDPSLLSDGGLCGDNANLALATVLYLSKTDANGNDQSDRLLAMGDSTSAAKGVLVLRLASGEEQSFTVTGVSDLELLSPADAVVSLDVTLLSGSDAVSAGDLLYLDFSRTGDNGSASSNTTFLLTGILTPAQITSNQNNYAPTGHATNSVFRLSSDASRNITGLAGGADGRIVIIHNIGSQNIVLKDDDTSSTAANRFALTGDSTLSADSVAILQYDNTTARWRAVSGLTPELGNFTPAMGSPTTIRDAIQDVRARHYDTRTSVAADLIPATVNAIRTSGYTAIGDGGAALYVRVVSEPAHAGKVQSADGTWWEIAEVRPGVKMFGAVGDGATNDRVAIQAAIDAAYTIGSGSLYVPPGEYLVSGGVLTNPGIRIYGAGTGATVFRKSGLLNMFVAFGAAFSGGSANTLAADVAAGSKSVTLGSGYSAAYSVGQTCILKDEGPWAGLWTGPPPRNGEFVTIQNITGDVITFWSPIRLSYKTIKTARLVSINLLSGVSYSDFTVVMDDTQDPANMWNNGPDPSDITTVGAAFSGVALYRPHFENLEIRRAIGPGIMLAGCLNARIKGLKCSDFGSATTGTVDPSSTDGTGGFGYGICEAELNEGLVATDLEFERIRHGYTTVGGNRFFNDCGVPTGSLISNGVHRDAKDMAWDTHAPGDSIVFNNLLALGGRGCGFQVRSRRQRILNCTAISCDAAGLWIRGGAYTNSIQGNFCDVENFRSIGTNTSTYYPGAINWTNYGAIVDDAYDTTIDGARVSHCGGPLITIGLFTTPIRPTYRNLHGDGLCQITSTKTYAVDAVQIGTNGKARIDGLQVRSNDGRVTHLIFRARGGDQISMNNIHGIGHTGDVYASDDGRDGVIDGSVSLTNSGAPMLAQSGPKVFIDDFDGTALKTGWTTAKGSNGSCTLAAIASLTNGAIRLTTGADAGGTMALNGTQIAGELNWKPDVGGLTAEFRVKMSATTNVAVFVGLTDQVSSLEMPFELGAGDALTSNASNGCGILFDTSADTDNWWLVGVKADTDATKQNSGKTPAGSTWERWRVSVAADGSARFYWEGALVGTVMTNATTPSTRLCLVVAALSRSSASRLIDVDYIAAEQTRTSTSS